MRSASASTSLPADRPASDAADRLVSAHAALVHRLARHVRRRGGAAIEFEDLVQAGMVALVEAARRYEDRGYGFATYATTRVKGAMIDHLRAQSLQPRSAILFRKSADRAHARLSGAFGRTPTDHEMAAALAIPAELFRRRRLDALDIRLESLAQVYSDMLPAFALEEESAEDRLHNAQYAERLARALDCLSEREARVLRLYFGEEHDLAEIGAVLGVGAARVCQIKKRAIERLRTMLAPPGNPA